MPFAIMYLSSQSSSVFLPHAISCLVLSDRYEGNPCNMHLMDLAAEVKAGVEEIGLVGYRFNTIGVSDGISMGTDGMSFSLQSRDIIADSIETVMSAQWYDANISLPGEGRGGPGDICEATRWSGAGRVNARTGMDAAGSLRL